MNCLHCHAETTNGLALCDLCQYAATMALGAIPPLYRNAARWKPGRAPTRTKATSCEPTSLGRSGDDRVTRALDEIQGDLVSWAMLLSEERGIDLPRGHLADRMTTAVCQLLAEHLTTVATMEWCGEMVRMLTIHADRLRDLSAVVGGWYGGACRTCGCGVEVIPGSSTATCGGCGATTFARDHLEVVLAEAAEWVATPKRLAEAIVALRDDQESVGQLRARISMWSSRGRIHAHRTLDDDGDPIGPKRHRLGDVLSLMETHVADCIDQGAITA